jgi:hypothetical protein
MEPVPELWAMLADNTRECWGSVGSGTHSRAGVFGWSHYGRGGIFGAGSPYDQNIQAQVKEAYENLAEIPPPDPLPNQSYAQIRLLPALVKERTDQPGSSVPFQGPPWPSLPARSQTGDLMVVALGPRAGTEPPNIQLWLCISSGSVDDRSTQLLAIWAQVQLSHILEGNYVPAAGL